MTTTLGAITPGEAVYSGHVDTPDFCGWPVIIAQGRRECRFEGLTAHEANANALLYVDAHNTAQKTGKLPSQLLQERDELVGVLREMMKHCHYNVMSTVQGNLYNEALKHCQDTLSKYPKP